MPDVQHALVYFNGHVQGVGFRYTALQVAREYEVAGAVQNLTDGRVQVDVEGEPEEVAAYIAALEERMKYYIKKVERSSRTGHPQFSGFVIK